MISHQINSLIFHKLERSDHHLFLSQTFSSQVCYPIFVMENGVVHKKSSKGEWNLLRPAVFASRYGRKEPEKTHQLVLSSEIVKITIKCSKIGSWSKLIHPKTFNNEARAMLFIQDPLQTNPQYIFH